MPGKTVKERCKDVFTAIKYVFKPLKPITQKDLEKEAALFVKEKGYDVSNPNFDINKFQSELSEYLKNKGYSFDSIDASLTKTPDSKFQMPKNIRKISEVFNKLVDDIDIFSDTTDMTPGLICYTIVKIEPNDKTPWVTYKPEPRIITEIHDTGVNQGTVFLTYSHKFVRSNNFENAHYVVSESETLYSPLTEPQAKYICQLLNAQSRILYRQEMKKLERVRQEKTLTLQKQVMQQAR